MIRKSAWLLSAGLVALTTPAFAQPDSQPASPADQRAAQLKPGTTAETAAVQNQAKERQPIDTGNIVITATRRNQALSDVPLAVSAVTAQTLRYTGANDIRQLNQVAPSLLVSSTSSEAGAAVARIRGIGTVGDNPGLESSVGVFIDGVYRSRTGIGLTDLGAIDRIEVLRGPQGTLFGRNTSAGLISIITAKPRFEPEISGQVDVGNYGLVRLEGSATGPITNGLAVRIDSVYDRRDGFLKDVISGRRVNGRNRWMVRGQLLYQPNDDFSFRLIGDLSHQREECCAATYLPAHDVVTNGAGGTVLQPSTIAAIERGLGGIINDDTFAREVAITPGRSYRSSVDDGGISGEANLDLGWGQLTSITAYRYNKYIRGQDAGFNNLDILDRADDGGSYNRFRTFTQELRLQGKALGGHLDWLLGGYYANEKLRVVDNLAYGGDYSRFANCLVAANFAGATGQAGLLDPANPTCFNPLVANAVLPFIPAAQQPVLSAFARLGLFAAPIFNNSGFSNLATANGLPGQSMNFNSINDRWNQTSNNWAIFTHDIISITDNLKFTAGLRYTHERKTLNASLMDNNVLCGFYSAFIPALQALPCVNPSAPGGSMSLNDALSESRLSGTAVLSYKIGPLLTYASYSRGYKAGGFNLDRSALNRSGGNGAIIPTTNADALKFKPETNQAFELGAKYHGRGIDINVAVFRELFKNFQLNTFNGLNFVVENINSCSNNLNGADTDKDPTTGACTGSLRAGVRTQGVELEAFTRPIPDVQWNAGVTLADTKYRRNLVGADGVPLTIDLFQLPGRQVSNAPKWTVTSSLAFTPAIGGSGLRALFYIDGRYMSSFNTGSNLDIEKIQKAFTVFNGRVGIHGPDDTWGLEFWAQNMFNKHFIQVAFDAPIQGSGTTRGVEAGFYPVATQLYGAFLGEPRTFGLTLRTKIGFHRPPPPAYVPPPPPPPPPVVEQPAPPPPPPPPPPPAPAPERG